MILAVDTETTGLDIFHGARPFAVTTCDGDGEQILWTWKVDPLTRRVDVDQDDVEHIKRVIASADVIVGHNLKFDWHALRSIGVELPWDKVEDTFVAGHLLASGLPHGLDDMVLHYLGEDLDPAEDALAEAVLHERRRVQQARLAIKRGKPKGDSDMAAWRIADKGLPEMPSETKEIWRADYWLPAAAADRDGTDDGDPRRTVAEAYANLDSKWTLELWRYVEGELRARSLWAIYRERMKLPLIAARMEAKGVTINRKWLSELWSRFREDNDEADRLMVGIADSLGHDLTLPKGSSNESLRKMLLDVLQLPPVAWSEKTGEPSIDKEALEVWEATLPPKSVEQLFVKTLLDRRKRGTAIAYLEGYNRWWLPLGGSHAADAQNPTSPHPGARIHQLRAGAGQTDVVAGRPTVPGVLRVGVVADRGAVVAVAGGGGLHAQQRRPAPPIRVGRNVAAGRSNVLVVGGGRSGDGGPPVASGAGGDWFVLHPQMNCCGTDHLRWSSNSPNIQNLSKKKDFNLRRCFGPAPGREWWSPDYENIELRIPAFEAGEDELIEVFLHPERAPYFGSYHLAVFDTLHPALFAKKGKTVKEPEAEGGYASTWYQWVKNGNFACVPMSTQALTLNGWKSYEDITVGKDVVLAYEDGKLVWTPVLEKVKYDDAPLMKMENDNFSVTSTPNHRWLGTKRCRTRNKPTYYELGFFTTEEMTTEHSIALSAPVEDKSSIPISDCEAAIIGFVYGDGGVTGGEFTGATSQAGGRKVKFEVKIFQKKPEGIAYVDALMRQWGRPFKKYVRSSGIHVWVLSPVAARDLWTRASLSLVDKDSDMEDFVLRMGRSQRESYLDAIHRAEGWVDRLGIKHYAQNCGKLADSIALAVFMSGKFPRTYVHKGSYPTPNQMSYTREGRPQVTGQRLTKTDAGRGQVWCLRTKQQTWVMRQDGQIMLTGNTLYGAQKATADRAYHVDGAFEMIRSRFRKIAALNDKMLAHANRHGFVETIPDRSVDPARGYPIMTSRSEWGRVIPTLPLNYHVSGTAMQCTNRAMVRCQNQLDEWRDDDGFDAWMVIQCHDEIVFDFPRGEGEEPWRTNKPRADALGALMAKSGDDIGVPVPVQMEYNAVNWAEGSKV